jgi:cyclic-di-AMP phosphodiesterase PgpH
MASFKTKNCISGTGLAFIPQRTPVIFAIAVVSLTGVMGQRLYFQPQLKEGMISPETITAPQTSLVEDKKQTEAKRSLASKSSEPVLMVDGRINEVIDKNLQQVLDKGNDIRATLGSFPFFDSSTLSYPTQLYLRSSSDSQWQGLLLAVSNSTPKPGVSTAGQNNTVRGQRIRNVVTGFGNNHFDDNNDDNNYVDGGDISLQTQESKEEPKTKTEDFSQNAEFIQAVNELQAYRLTTSAQNLSLLLTKIQQARERYAQTKAKLFLKNADKLELVYDKTDFLELSDEEWAKTQIGIRDSAERILTQGIPPGLPKTILEDAVSRQVQTLVPKNAENLATKLLLLALQANLKKDETKTRIKAEKAAARVEAIRIQIIKGSVILRKGEKITPWNLQVLEHYHLIRRQINWFGLVKLGGIVTCAVGVFALVEFRSHTQLRQRDRILVLLLNLSTPLVITMGLPFTTWSAVGMLLGSFYGGTLGATALGILTLLLPISQEISRITLFAGAVGGIIGSAVAPRLRSREELALLGLGIAITQSSVFLLLKLLTGAVFGAGWYLLLQDAALFGLSGLAWSIVALGLSPYLEQLFDLVTPIRLAELSSPNRPLLKRLATEAPGTFQHTLFVATLAEAAAKKLACNVELVRAGTLYHDVGKMHDPLGFIENQMGGPNKHDTEIDDPWKSAKLIKKHVSEGLVMARKHRLPTAIQAFIPEHQGTMQIAYFYHKATQMAQENPTIIVDEEYFRYEGPIPQSRETAIVMLADSCEAALRSLKEATPEQALKMLNNILRARWQDNQLVDSGLTREEMNEIADIFVEVWQQFHHKRIAYPKAKVGSGE